MAKQGKRSESSKAPKLAPREAPAKWSSIVIGKVMALQHQGLASRAISREMRKTSLKTLSGGKWWSSTVESVLAQVKGRETGKASKPRKEAV